MNPSVERETKPSWAEPFSALYWRIRVQTYLVTLAFLVVAFQGYWLFRLGTEASAHVYEVHPDGKAIYIGDREANLAPRASEARQVARQFVELVYGWNSSTVHQDLALAVSLCARNMAEQFRQELADAQFLETIRRRAIRSEVAFERIDVVEEGRRHFTVALAGHVNTFPLTQYQGSPQETRPFSIVVHLAAVPREPDLRPNGLEVVRIQRQDPSVPAQKEAP